ncbi:MAG: hypothetical protein PHO94_04925 [Petrimonas sp.]|nr:hypothetical protein [Petrimonas sp.]
MPLESSEDDDSAFALEKEVYHIEQSDKSISTPGIRHPSSIIHHKNITSKI